MRRSSRTGGDFDWTREAERRAALFDVQALTDLGICLDPGDYDFVFGYPSLERLPAVLPDCDPLADADARSDSAKIALYVHIPFCSGICTYCSFSRYESQDRAAVRSYLGLLESEMRLWEPRLQSRPVHSVYIGGGTPTILHAEEVELLLSTIHRFLGSQRLHTLEEFTCECSPETATEPKLRLLRDHGVDRISIGVQTFDDQLLRDLNRRHDASGARAAMAMIAEAGFRTFNVDLMYGFPSQSAADVLDDLSAIGMLCPPSITAYQLWTRADTPLMSGRDAQLPSVNELVLMKVLIRSFLSDLGYAQDQADWYVREPASGFRQQKHKWRNGDFIGFGPGAYGYYSGVSYCNESALPVYQQRVQAGSFPTGRAQELSAREISIRRAALGLKLAEGTQLPSTSEDDALRSALLKVLVDLGAKGFAQVLASSARLTADGLLFADQIVDSLFLRSRFALATP